jgi:hypothetical protein
MVQTAQVPRRGEGRRRDAGLEAVLLVGVAAIFTANALAAVLEPNSFRSLLGGSAISRAFGLHLAWWPTMVIAANDAAVAVVAVAALGRRGWRRPALAWAGLWLAVAAAIKLTSVI